MCTLTNMFCFVCSVLCFMFSFLFVLFCFLSRSIIYLKNLKNSNRPGIFFFKHDDKIP